MIKILTKMILVLHFEEISSIPTWLVASTVITLDVSLGDHFLPIFVDG